MTRRQVDDAEEERDEHAALVVVARQGIVHQCTYFGRGHTLRGQCLEQTRGLCHEQRGRHSLARYVANGKVQAVVLQHVAVQVATDLTGWGHRGIHVEAVANGEVVRHHRHLDVAGNLQFTLDAFLGGLYLRQALRSTHSVYGEDDEENHHRHEDNTHPEQSLLRQLGFLMCYLFFLLLRFVDDCQLLGIAAVLVLHDRVQQFYDFCGFFEGFVLAPGFHQCIED